MPRAGVVLPMVDRKERLAVNLYDLAKVHPTVRQVLLAGKLDLSAKPEWVDRTRKDETAIVFTCDVLTAATVCDVLRDESRKTGETPPRVYVFRGRAWTRVSGEARLTTVTNGRVSLCPSVFRPDVVDDYAAPEFKALY